jgi:2-polyprenyl-3-methyl-5-hydroxy-6-metoxy-1,4-benzoquinol methylase
MITSDNKQEWENCNLCSSNKLKVFYKDKHICQCADCKFVFYKSIPSKDELDAVYSNYSREEYITDISKNKISSELRRLLSSHHIKNVLDIACGECYFLDILQDIDHRLNLYATEHETGRERVISKGHNYIEGEFFPKTDIKFDLIIFTEAIEHINDVSEFLESAYELLRPGGLIYITTPNFSSLERLIMGSKWGMVTPPEHLSYFTVSTLNKIMNRSKFQKIYSITENISIFRIMEFFNAHMRSPTLNQSSNISPQQVSDRLQQASSNNFFLGIAKGFINFILLKLHWGSSLKALYKK